MEVHILPLEELAIAAANRVSRLSARAIAERKRFTVALSGGSLIRLLGPPLAAEPLRSQIDWAAWHVFWADERYLPLDHPESNYSLARDHLFDHVHIPPAQVHAVETGAANPAAAATAYQATLKQVFQPPSGQLPRFDLILLGMGADGHTASLFPGRSLLSETERWAAPVFDSPKPPPERITLTLPVINNARQVLFVVAGESKADTIQKVLNSNPMQDALPAQRVQPARGELHWFVDEAAAAKLTRS